MVIKKIIDCIRNCYLSPKLFFNHIYIYKPSMYYISSKSKIIIKKHILFNKQFDFIRQNRNIIAGNLYIGNNTVVEVNEFCFYAGCRLTINHGAVLKLGTGYMNYNSVIECFNRIEIGENVVISEGVHIRDSNNHTIIEKNYHQSRPIKIGNNVWIGVGATILSGVTIGDGAIIAANALVNKSVPSKTLVAGIPAKVIKENIEWK